MLINVDDRRGYLPILADALGGAWSDDDSDIEFVYLHTVERHGLELNYAQVTEAWRTHINRFIWAANRRARDLMAEGLVAPATGGRLARREGATPHQVLQRSPRVCDTGSCRRIRDQWSLSGARAPLWEAMG